MDKAALLICVVSLIATEILLAGQVDYLLLSVSFLVCLPALYIILNGGGFGKYLIGVGDLFGGLKASAVLLLLAIPIIAYGASLAEFRQYYPLWKPASESTAKFIHWELKVFVLMFATEFFYRGFLLKNLMDASRYGNHIHAFLYMLAHIGKPSLEVLYSLPVGFIFGKAALKYKSILPSLIMHYTSSVVFDALIVYG